MMDNDTRFRYAHADFQRRIESRVVCDRNVVVLKPELNDPRDTFFLETMFDVFEPLWLRVVETTDVDARNRIFLVYRTPTATHMRHCTLTRINTAVSHPKSAN